MPNLGDWHAIPVSSKERTEKAGKTKPIHSFKQEGGMSPSFKVRRENGFLRRGKKNVIASTAKPRFIIYLDRHRNRTRIPAPATMSPGAFLLLQKTTNLFRYKMLQKADFTPPLKIRG
ncbi:hypothetical protein KJ784_00410, partial [Patescibacteria group bacterium]|nr:hypothetical protein [Patescibacteria group bacterium]